MINTIIKTDGTREYVLPKNGEYYELEELQKIVGGYIEIVPSHHRGIVFVVNEEGRLNCSEYNSRASQLALTPLYGDVFICHSERIK